jgi:cbb3-type cytochrome oxidase subunit 3
MMGLIRGGATLVLLLVFLGIVAWAYGGRRKQQFDAMARLALEADAPQPQQVASTPSVEERAHE